MKSVNRIVIMFVVLLLCVMSTEVAWAGSAYYKGGDESYKAPFVPQTEYEKKLAEFSKPKGELFTIGDSARGYHITNEEHKILNGLKMKESRRIMLENDGTKFDDEWETSQPLDNTSLGISNFFNNGHWSFYFDQQWGAYGDPFIRKDEDKKQKTKDFTGHAAIGDYKRIVTLEAMPGQTLSWRRDVWFRPANNKVRPETSGKHLYYALPNNGGWAQLRIKGAEDKQYKKARAYGNSRVGAPYNNSFMKNDNSLYCSEVVVFSWDGLRTNCLMQSSRHSHRWLGAALGNHLFGHGINIIPGHWGRNFIWPMNIYDSPKTYVYRGLIN